MVPLVNRRKGKFSKKILKIGNSARLIFQSVRRPSTCAGFASRLLLGVCCPAQGRSNQFVSLLRSEVSSSGFTTHLVDAPGASTSTLSVDIHCLVFRVEKNSFIWIDSTNYWHSPTVEIATASAIEGKR